MKKEPISRVKMKVIRVSLPALYGTLHVQCLNVPIRTQREVL